MGPRRITFPLITEILALRYERAQLLGYADFAAFKLEPEMAGTAERVEELLTEVWNAAKSAPDADGAQLSAMMQDDGVNAELPWDWRYYAERKRRAEHDLDEAEASPT